MKEVQCKPDMKAEQVLQIIKDRVKKHAIQSERLHGGKNPRYKGRAEGLRMVEAWIKELRPNIDEE